MSRRAAAPSRTILPDPKFSSDMLAKFMKQRGDADAYAYAEIYAQWGNTRSAFEWLEKAVRLRRASSSDGRWKSSGTTTLTKSDSPRGKPHTYSSTASTASSCA